MPTRLIFICHSQLEQEKENGLKLVSVINETPGFKAFFAETVHDTDGLSQHIFANLERCDGFLAVMHKRGEVKFLGRRFIRGSVWIQQELAIVSFLNHQRQAGRRIKVRVFAQRGIKREGLADVLILNPIEFEHDQELPDLVAAWLRGPDFMADPVVATREDLFRLLTRKFKEEHWRYLGVLMVLSRGTTQEVAHSHVMAMLRKMAVPGGALDQVENDLLANGFLLRGSPDPARGMVPVSLAPAFIDLVADELQRRGGFWRRGA